MPVVITATDFDNGKSIHFTQGELTKRIAASCCIPVLFKPVVINKVHYVDGGVFMNIPVSPIRPLCEKVLALNVFKLNASAYSQNIVSIARQEELYGGSTPEEAARIFGNVLQNKATRAQTDCVLINASFAIQAMKPASSIEACVAEARESLESGKAFHTFRHFLELNR